MALIDSLGTTTADQMRWARQAADLAMRSFSWLRGGEHPTFLVADWSIVDLTAVLSIVAAAVALAPPASDVHLLRQVSVAVIRIELATRLAVRELEDQG